MNYDFWFNSFLWFYFILFYLWNTYLFTYFIANRIFNFVMPRHSGCFIYFRIVINSMIAALSIPNATIFSQMLYKLMPLHL